MIALGLGRFPEREGLCWIWEGRQSPVGVESQDHPHFKPCLLLTLKEDERRTEMHQSQRNQPLRKARHGTAEIFGTNEEESLMRSEPEDLEYSIGNGRESLRTKSK